MRFNPLLAVAMAVAMILSLGLFPARQTSPAIAAGTEIEQPSASGDEAVTPMPDSGEDKLVSDRYDDWHHPMESGDLAQAESITSDHFGYQVDDTVPLQWVNASSGTEVFIDGGDRDDNYSEAISIGFGFKFYEKTFDQVYIGTNGFLSFGEGSESFSNRSIPEDPPPNNLVAAFWDDLDLASGKVFYKRVNAPSGRSFVVEWFNVVRYNSSDLLTFEIILYENGNIRYQYQELNGILNQATVGIEDGDGVDGLLYAYNQAKLSSGKAIKFSRPPAEPRVKILPLYQSGFAVRGVTSFTAYVRNTNENGSDTYDLHVDMCDPGWETTFFGADGITQLNDTDSDGVFDTGSLDHGQTRKIILRVTAPSTINVGEYCRFDVQATSSDDLGKSATMQVQAAVPAGFAQAYADSQAGIYLSLTWKQRAIASQAANFFTGNTLSIAAIGEEGYVFGWERNGEKTINNQTAYFSDIEYLLIDSFGEVIRPLSALTNNGSSATPNMLVNARYPALAGTPDGRIGVLWAQYKLNVANSSTNSNVFFAILDSSGQRVFGPINLTNSTEWRGSGNEDVPLFNSPRITATGDNRFVLTWIAGKELASGEINSLNYAIYQSSGMVIKDPKIFAQSVPGETLYIDPTLAELSGNRFLMAFSIYHQLEKSYIVAYTILNSGGSTLKDITPVANSSGWRVDAVEFETEDFLLAWTDPGTERITFVILNKTGSALVSEPKPLPMVGKRNPDYVSASSTVTGHVLLTWMDAEWKDYLFYSLINSSGSVVTPPMIFTKGQAENPLVQTSFTGQGVAPYDGKWQTFMPAVLQR